MKPSDALALVIELAEQNSLNDREAQESPELGQEMRRQERAIKQTKGLLKSLRFFKPVTIKKGK